MFCSNGSYVLQVKDAERFSAICSANTASFDCPSDLQLLETSTLHPFDTWRVHLDEECLPNLRSGELTVETVGYHLG